MRVKFDNYEVEEYNVVFYYKDKEVDRIEIPSLVDAYVEQNKEYFEEV